MKPGLVLAKAWSDEDLVGLHVEACDGVAAAAVDIYSSPAQLLTLAGDLARFAGIIDTRVFECALGRFGDGFALGALHMRMQFQLNGRLHITLRLQSAFAEFGQERVASEATLHLRSEPALLDEFVRGLTAMATSGCTDAALEVGGALR